jgi:Skp family chaperone for outer membrane proteins
MIKTFLIVSAVLWATSASAIELSLEENRAERGSVGYVDMQRLFTASPDSQRAKEGFEELVRQAEERVNLRKAELLKLHQELDGVRGERESLLRSTPTVSAPPQAPPAATPLAAPAVAASTASVKTLALPGMTGIDRAPAAVTASSAPASVAASTVTALAAAAPVVPAGPTLGQKLLELDGKILSLQADISRKEAELARDHDEADHGLLDAESRKTDQVLARLYRAVTAVARREGVSVVIDKSTLLYGHPAVDITDKVLKQLREAPQP